MYNGRRAGAPISHGANPDPGFRADSAPTAMALATVDESGMPNCRMVLMRRHGATVAGTTLEELTFRTIYTARNAAMQIEAHNLGHVSPLNAAETKLAGEYNLKPGPVARAFRKTLADVE